MDTPGDMAYRAMLNDIGKRLSEDELLSLKYLCRDFIPRRRGEEIMQPHELWDALEERGKLSISDISYLKNLIRSGANGRADLSEIIERFERWSKPMRNAPEGKGLRGHQSAGCSYNELKSEIDFIQKNIGRDWKHFARYLDVSESDIQTALYEWPRDLKEQVRQVLVKWYQNCHGTATKGQLIEALEMCDRNDLAQALTGNKEVKFG